MPKKRKKKVSDPQLQYLGERIKVARNANHLTQQALADQAGIGLRHYQNRERAYQSVFQGFICNRSKIGYANGHPVLPRHFSAERRNRTATQQICGLHGGGTAISFEYCKLHGRAVYKSPPQRDTRRKARITSRARILYRLLLLALLCVMPEGRNRR